MYYRSKFSIVEAIQWFKDGDHPNVVKIPDHILDTIESRTTAIGINQCRWITAFGGGHLVSPGDYIITGASGESYPCRKDMFEFCYEKC